MFAAALPAVQSKALLVIHTLVHGATIRLNEPLANDHAFARTKALSGARAIVDILVKTDVPKVGVIDPVLAVSRISRIRSGNNSTHDFGTAALDLRVSRAYCRGGTPARPRRPNAGYY